MTNQMENNHKKEDDMEFDNLPDEFVESFDAQTFSDNLRVYYQKCFPYQAMFQWLNYSNTTPTNNFTRREFSFTLPGDIYIRYQSFDNANEFKTKLNLLNPIKIDIGSIYTQPPKLKNTLRPAAFQPISKELVFDIDLTDYDEIRTCCSEANICLKCWKLMTIALKIIYTILTDDFDFKEILVIYSGRRGIHIWVCDERARNLNNDQRRSIVNYIDIIKGGVNQGRKVSLSNHLHPSLGRFFYLIEENFIEIALQDQQILASPDRWNKVFEFFPEIVLSATDRKSLSEEWSRHDQSSEERWEDLIQLIKSNSKKMKSKSSAVFDNAIRDIKFQYVYPRLDINVSTHLNHLLKAPFCVHPKTERVCVPIPPEEFDTFDPLSVPCLQNLVNQVHQTEAKRRKLDSEQEAQPSKIAWTHTDLSPSIKYFKEFVEQMNSKLQKDSKSIDF